MDIKEGLTFDDVLLIPKRSPVMSRKEVSVETWLTAKIKLNIPIVSANMDTVTESAMAIAIARQGGIGIIHRFLPIEKQVEEVLKAKRSESFIIEQPVTINQAKSLKDARQLMTYLDVGGIIVIDDNEDISGILTTRDILFQENPKIKVSEIMTKKSDLITAPYGITLDEAKKILSDNRIEKLPLLDGSGKLKGLITTKDISKKEKYPVASKDIKGRLLVGAAVGVKDDYIERATSLYRAGCDVLVVDIAHGHSDIAIKAIKEIRKNLGSIPIIAGNVATAEGTKDLIKADVDCVKAGVGGGSICITRIVTGAGVPQLTAIMECAKIAQKESIPIIADGGIRNSGDLTKALAAGASSGMLGNLLAGTEESPGVIIMRQGKRYKIYRGMASFEANLKRKQKQNNNFEIDTDLLDMTPEGVESLVAYKGYTSEIIMQLINGLKSGVSYCGAKNIRELQKNAEFIKMSPAGLRESYPHDVDVLK